MNKILIGVVVAIVAVGGFFILSGSKTNNTATVSVSSTPLATPTASATTSASPSAKKTEEATVTVTANGFEPKTLTIKVGTKVTWINKSGETVTVNSDPHPIHNFWPFLNLGSFADGESVSATFDKTGTYTYHNHLNPSQKGTVVVE